MLIFPLKKERYEKIERGEKKIEYREKKRYWAMRLFSLGINITKEIPFDWYELKKDSKVEGEPPRIIFSKGYTKERLLAYIKRVEIVWGSDTDLKIDCWVYAIHFEVIRKITEMECHQLRKIWK